MKLYQKITAVFLLLGLLLSMGACSKIEQLADAVETKPFSAGTVEGSTYTNEFIGISCALDESWTISSQEELAQQMGMVADVFTDEDLVKQIESSNSAFLFMATQNDGLGNINITASNTESFAAALSDQNAIVDEVAAQLPEAFAASSMEVIDCGTGSISFCGEEHYGIQSHLSYYDVPIYQRQILLIRGTYSVTITISTYYEDTTQELLDLFTSLEN